jgi:hypothetical protein
MILSTVLNLFVVPVVYVALAGLRERLARRGGKPPSAPNGRSPEALPVTVVRRPDGEIVLS